jgi:hypothetical protein
MRGLDAKIGLEVFDRSLAVKRFERLEPFEPASVFSPPGIAYFLE